MTELTMCECGHAAIHHYAHGRCGVENEMCSCLNLVVAESLSINPAIAEGFRTMMKGSLDR